MPRPPSIVLFDRLYLASLGVYLLDLILFWSAKREAVLRSPQLQMRPDLVGVVVPLMIAMMLVVTLVSVALWWAVARRGSGAAKWIVVATEAIGVLLQAPALIAVLTGRADPLVSILLELVATVLAVAAAAMLFRSDARPWFAQREQVA